MDYIHAFCICASPVYAGGSFNCGRIQLAEHAVILQRLATLQPVRSSLAHDIQVPADIKGVHTYGFVGMSRSDLHSSWARGSTRVHGSANQYRQNDIACLVAFRQHDQSLAMFHHDSGGDHKFRLVDAGVSSRRRIMDRGHGYRLYGGTGIGSRTSFRAHCALDETDRHDIRQP